MKPNAKFDCLKGMYIQSSFVIFGRNNFIDKFVQATFIMKFIFTFFSVALLLALNGCDNILKGRGEKKHSGIFSEADKPLFIKQYPDFDLQILKDSLKSSTQSDSILHTYFSSSDFAPLWIKDTLDVKSLQSLSSVFAKVEEHGLPNEFFKDWKRIGIITDAINDGDYIGKSDSLYHNLTVLNKITVRLISKYVAGMTYGFLDPKSLFFDDYAICIQKPDSTFYDTLHADLREDPLAAVINAQPRNPVYLRMQHEYRVLDSIKDIELPAIKEKGTNLNYKIGDKSRNITLIAQRLMMTGEYSPVADSLINDSLHMVLDDDLLEAVNRFRQKMSYPTEKEIGKNGIDALNRPIRYYMDRLKANMERYRWRRSKNTHNKNIEVNVASFRLVATQKDSLPLYMNVCVGLPSNKTPLLQADLSYINLNPKWNVPHSIAKNETVVMQKRDTSYLRRHNMRLYGRDNKEIDRSTIDWKNVNPASFRYMIKQDSGDSNSLGRIKFMFNNAFSVYLHDTPSKRFFLYKNRAVSHGCVRVQKPIDLAFFCLSPVSDQYKDQLLYSINKNVQTSQSKKLLSDGRLKKLNDILPLNNQGISLFIDYCTVYMLPNEDNLYYADDVYGYDKIILDALKGIKPVRPFKENERKGV